MIWRKIKVLTRAELYEPTNGLFEKIACDPRPRLRLSAIAKRTNFEQ